MAKQKTKNLINFFDATIILVILVIAGLFIYSQYIYQAPETGNIYVTVKAPAENIEAAALIDKDVFFNGVNRQVEVKKVEKQGGDLIITLYGPGQVKADDNIFNGQRILINQRVEIHGAYFVIGRVLSFTNEK